MHKVPDYLLNPTHQITVSLIGCGGTGSHVLGHLGSIDVCLKGLGHPGLMVYAYDPDVVTEANKGRQRFTASDIGLNKAQVLITRINRIQGTSWKSITDYFTDKSIKRSNIYLSCVDTVKARREISKILKDESKKYNSDFREPYYWMDFGNARNTGQVILGTLSNIKQPKSKKYDFISNLPTLTEMYDLSKVKDKDSGPSCSTLEALSKQDLFINPTLAALGCDLLWQMISYGMIDKAGLFLNLQTMKTNPILLS